MENDIILLTKIISLLWIPLTIWSYSIKGFGEGDHIIPDNFEIKNLLMTIIVVDFIFEVVTIFISLIILFDEKVNFDFIFFILVFVSFSLRISILFFKLGYINKK